MKNKVMQVARFRWICVLRCSYTKFKRASASGGWRTALGSGKLNCDVAALDSRWVLAAPLYLEARKVWAACKALMRNFESALELLVSEGVIEFCDEGRINSACVLFFWLLLQALWRDSYEMNYCAGGAISLEQYCQAQDALDLTKRSFLAQGI